MDLDNFLDPEFIQNPYPAYTRLRREHPVRWNPMFRTWVVSRYPDVRTVFQDVRRFSSDVWGFAWKIGLPRTPEELASIADFLPFLTQQLQAMDAPAHTRQRALVSKAFTPRLLESLRPRIQTLIDDLIGRFESDGQCDFISQFAYPLPSLVILDLLGVDREGYHYIRASARAISAFSPALYSPEPGQLQKIAETLRASAGFLRKLIAERRTHPRDDLVSALIRAEDSGQMLSEDEVIVLCNFLLFAGHETTANLMGTGLMYLLQRREQWELLLQDRALVPNAVEELLRYASPVAILARMVAEKLELHGQTLAEGDKVYVLIAAANRDPDEFSEPETLDIARHDARSLGFGYGAHFCIGAALARLETQMALATLLDRFPNLRLASEQVEYLPIHWLRALKELRLAW